MSRRRTAAVLLLALLVPSTVAGGVLAWSIKTEPAANHVTWGTEDHIRP